jgi:tRNA modification GTPase
VPSSEGLLGAALSLLDEPIVAISSAAGPAAIGIVRLSGSAAAVAGILDACLGAQASDRLQPRHMHLREVRHPASGELLDEGLVVRFPGPASYTGEDLVEFHLHGNPLLLERVQEALCDAGARPAGPGEFTRRAVQHGRMSLLQAEAVDALVRAEGEAGVKVAQRHMGGELERRLESWRSGLLAVAAGLEALVDFPEEVSEEELLTELAALPTLVAQMQTLLASFRSGRRLVEGCSLVLRGPVNVGKSTLFNGLVGHSRAIVSERAGTTRDVVSETVLWGGLSVRLHDTAGLASTSDAIEEEGIARGGAVAQRADLLLELRDARTLVGGDTPAQGGQTATIWVASHCDCIEPQQAEALRRRGWLLSFAADEEALLGIREQVVASLRAELPSDGLALHTARQQRALALALAATREAHEHADAEPVLAAVALRSAGQALEELSGRWRSEEVLDELFERFCIGK